MCNVIDSAYLCDMLSAGAKNLSMNAEYVNSINVFPIPDGDTGTNMKATITGAVAAGEKNKDKPIGEFSQVIAKAAVMNARGNSGVILSQFIKGLSTRLADKESVGLREFAAAMNGGYEKAYEVVANPTEGTMLTVMREAAEKAYAKINDETTLEEYLVTYCFEAHESLKRTPELLPVLKKAGVIDSGGAGFTYIADGMLKAVRGEEVEGTGEIAATKSVDASAFNADSELTFGYCTEFILQLQNSKVNTAEFPLKTVTDYLDSVNGESVVAFKDDDIIKVHVHTFDPGRILSEMRKYGEFLTVKIENMNLQHSENGEYFKDMPNGGAKVEHKRVATVVVANGEGLAANFRDMGVDKVVSGGQTMNTSTKDFIEAFDELDADYIFVYPNNKNIVMAAELAASDYKKAKVIVIPTKSIAEGNSAVSMLDPDGDIEAMTAEQNEIISSVTTVEVTYAVRDVDLDGVSVDKGDYICMSGKRLLSGSKVRLEAVKQALLKIEDFSDKQLMTLIVGEGVPEKEADEICDFVAAANPVMEICRIAGGQKLYGYIIGLE